MNKIKDADFMMKFPLALQKDKSMFALGQLIAEELHITAHETEKNIIYANIDELSETWLDVLAYDLHVDWYDYDYPVETKRKIIKNSIRVHQKLGTKYAVETVLQDVYRTAKVVEWFDYGGRPYTFKITVNIGNEGLSEDTSREIVSKMQFYKNLRSHCDGIFYILSIEKATVKAVALHEVGTTLKVKPLLQENIKAAGKAKLRAATFERLELKVKPLLQKSIKAAGQNDIRAATLTGAILKVKPLLDTEIITGTTKAVTARLQALNSIKVKYYTPDVLRAGTEAVGSVRAYHRSKLTMSIRKE